MIHIQLDKLFLGSMTMEIFCQVAIGTKHYYVVIIAYITMNCTIFNANGNVWSDIKWHEW